MFNFMYVQLMSNLCTSSKYCKTNGVATPNAFVQRYVWAWLWEGIIQTILTTPTWLVIGIPGIALAWLCRGRGRLRARDVLAAARRPLDHGRRRLWRGRRRLAPRRRLLDQALAGRLVAALFTGNGIDNAPKTKKQRKGIPRRAINPTKG